MLKFIIGAAVAVVLTAAGVGGYLYKQQHDRDVARQARIDRINRDYHADLTRWQSDMGVWKAKQATFTHCRDATDAAFRAGDALRGRIGTGGSFDQFMTVVDDLAVEVGSAGREADLDCQEVVADMDKAHSQASDGTNIWHEWRDNGKYAWADGPDQLPGMDKHFSKALDALSDAEVALTGLKPGPAPLKPTRPLTDTEV